MRLHQCCAHIGISVSQWYRIAKGKYQELSPKAKRKMTTHRYALTLEEKEAIVENAIDHPQYYHRELAYRMVNENIV
ncbi:MAG: hypothetical protein N3F66_15025 [Spirochaetes bacterium]|nr:hypothetical protein [Spirochaetota bacterium]